MSGWTWYCMRCHTELGPMAGKHKSTCPSCGCKSAYCSKRGSDEQPTLFEEAAR